MIKLYRQKKLRLVKYSKFDLLHFIPEEKARKIIRKVIDPAEAKIPLKKKVENLNRMTDSNFDYN